MADETHAERREQARMRATAAVSHFGTSSSAFPAQYEVRCRRCRLTMNRWNEPCDYAKTAEALLAEDVLWLLSDSKEEE